jgi:hypothetical protein
LQLWVPAWLFTALPPQMLLSSTCSDDAGCLLPHARSPEEASDVDAEQTETEPRAALATQLVALEGGDGERHADAEDQTDELGRLLPRPDSSAGEAEGPSAALSTSLGKARGLLPLLRRKVGRRLSRTLAVEDPTRREHKESTCATTGQAPRRDRLHAQVHTQEVLAICVAQYTGSWGLYGLLNWLPTYFTDAHGVEVGDLGGYTFVPYVVQGGVGVLAGLAADGLLAKYHWPKRNVRMLLQVCGMLGECRRRPRHDHQLRAGHVEAGGDQQRGGSNRHRRLLLPLCCPSSHFAIGEAR